MLYKPNITMIYYKYKKKNQNVRQAGYLLHMHAPPAIKKSLNYLQCIAMYCYR